MARWPTQGEYEKDVYHGAGHGCMLFLGLFPEAKVRNKTNPGMCLVSRLLATNFPGAHVAE